MISGKPTDFLVKWLETMQIEMAEGFIDNRLSNLLKIFYLSCQRKYHLTPK